MWLFVISHVVWPFGQRYRHFYDFFVICTLATSM
jgi:hypothetical protein